MTKKEKNNSNNNNKNNKHGKKVQCDEVQSKRDSDVERKEAMMMVSLWHAAWKHSKNTETQAEKCFRCKSLRMDSGNAFLKENPRKKCIK